MEYQPVVRVLWAAAGTAEELLKRASSGDAETSTSTATAAAAATRFDGRAFRRALAGSGRYQRKPKNDKDSLALMEEHGVGYSSTGKWLSGLVQLA